MPFFVLLLCWMFCCDFDIGFISSRFFSVGLVSTEIVVSLFNSQLRYGSALCISLVGAFVAESPDTSWVVDSGSTHHMTFDRSLFDPDSFTPITPASFSGVQMGNGSMADIKGCGTITLCTTVHRRDGFLKLSNVLYVPALRRNLLSISSFRQTHKISFQQTEVLFTPFGSRCVARAVFLRMACISCCSLPLSHLLQLWLMLPLQTTYLCNGIDG